MDVFISWAGKRSLAAAEALKDWIPMVINAAKPWLSKAHIPSGKLWRTELAESLSSCKFGIFCLTPAALQSNWIFFEGGAISKTLSDAHVCPLLFDLKPSDVQSPFADFQCRLADKDGVLALLETLNKALPEGTAISEAQLRKVFELLWPQLEQKLSNLPPDDEKETARQKRPQTEILEEILTRVRAIEQRENLLFARSSELTGRDYDLLVGRNYDSAAANADPQGGEAARILSKTYPEFRFKVVSGGKDALIVSTYRDNNSIGEMVIPRDISRKSLLQLFGPMLTKVK